MTNISAIALEVDKIAAQIGEDPYELFVLARGGKITNPPTAKGSDEAVTYIEHLIDTCSTSDIARIDRIVFDNATGQN